MDLQTLKTELALPVYADLIASGDDAGIADLLNAPTVGTISRGVIPKDLFILALQSGLSGLLGRTDTDPVKQSLTGWLKLLDMVTQIPTGDPEMLTVLASCVGAGVFTQAEVNAATIRPCSKAEQLDGVGVIASESDVAQTLHDQRQAAYETQQAAIKAEAEKLMTDNPDMDVREALERADQIINKSDWGHK